MPETQTSMTDAEIIQDEQWKVKELREFAESVRDEIECDEDAHVKQTYCARCEAKSVLYATEPADG